MDQIITHLSSQRKKLTELDQLEDAGRITAMVDVALISLYNRLTNRMGMDPKEVRRYGAVQATGEFGRRQLGPFSQINLLFLQTSENPLKEEAWSTGIVRPLEQAGWEVIFQLANIGEAVEMSLNDFDWLSAVVDGRFISGSRTLVDELRRSIREEIQANSDRHAIRVLLEDWKATGGALFYNPADIGLGIIANTEGGEGDYMATVDRLPMRITLENANINYNEDRTTF